MYRLRTVSIVSIQGLRRDVSEQSRNQSAVDLINKWKETQSAGILKTPQVR